MSEKKISPTYEKDKFYNIRCDKFQPNPDQPRKFFDEEPLTDLTTSAGKHGFFHPVLFGQNDDGKLFIVVGERRLRAALKAGHTTIPARFVEGNYPEIALEENLKREDLNPIELAEALNKLKDAYGYDDKRLTTIIGKAKSTVSEILSLNRLPQEIRDECRANSKISRQVLIDIAKKKTPRGMKTAFEEYKEREEAKLNPQKRYIQRRTWQNNFEGTLSDLKVILNKDFESLDKAERTNLISNIEELKKIADSFDKKIKATLRKKSKATVTSKPKRINIDIDINKIKINSGEKTKSAMTTMPERIAIKGKKAKK